MQDLLSWIYFKYLCTYFGNERIRDEECPLNKHADIKPFAQKERTYVCTWCWSDLYLGWPQSGKQEHTFLIIFSYVFWRKPKNVSKITVSR